MAIDVIIGFDSLALVSAIGLVVTWRWLVPVIGSENYEWPGLQRTALWFLALSLIALWLTSLAWLWGRTASMSGQSAWAALSVVPTVLFRSHFGEVWWLRAGAMLWASLVLVWMVCSEHRMHGAKVAAILFGLAWVAASRSAAGHAAASGDWTLREGMDWLHLISVSVWGGGLIVTMLLIFPRLKCAAPGERIGFGQRFSLIATWALAGVLISGGYSAWHMLPAVSAFWSSFYGQLLGVKLLLVAGMVACGWLNHYHWVPDLGAVDSAGHLIRVRRLRNTVLMETALLLCVLAVTAVLLGSEPPMA